MNRTRRFVAMGCLAFMCMVGVAATEESAIKSSVLRPPLVAAMDPCILVAAEGSYEVQKGQLIEIDVGSLMLSGCGHHEISFSIGDNRVLKPSKMGPWTIWSGENGMNSIVASFFRAHKRGHETITLTIDSMAYVYEIEVL